MDIYSTLPAPEKHPSIPQSAQWLAGEGAGSWYELLPDGQWLRMNRYAPDGKLECSGQFGSLDKNSSFELNQPFQFTYTSHCKRISLQQGGKLHIFWNILYKKL